MKVSVVMLHKVDATEEITTRAPSRGRAEAGAGITLMATPPVHQRTGMGRALLTQVIADYRGRGVGRFHLGSSEAGRRLYESLGFKLVADLPVWVLG